MIGVLDKSFPTAMSAGAVQPAMIADKITATITRNYTPQLAVFRRRQKISRNACRVLGNGAPVYSKFTRYVALLFAANPTSANVIYCCLVKSKTTSLHHYVHPSVSWWVRSLRRSHKVRRLSRTVYIKP